MARLEKIEFFDLPNVRIIGLETGCSLDPAAGNPIPAFWDKAIADGVLDKLKSLRPLALPDCTVGWMGDVQGQEYRYLLGVVAPEGAPVPEGMQFRDLPACPVAKGYLFGNLQNGDVYNNAHALTLEGIAANGYSYDYSFGWSAEVYPNSLDYAAEEGTFCYVQPYQK